MFFLGLGSFGIIDPGDGYFTEAAREMVESGDYVTPHLNYQIYFSKPILIYWLIASAYHVFGINEFAARFWSAVLTTGLVLATYWLGRCILNRKSGLLAGLILASSPLVVTFAKLSLVDGPFTALVGLAVIALTMTIVVRSKRWWPVLYASLALSVLTKGPVGVALLGFAFIAFAILRRPSLDVIKQWWGRLEPLSGTVILLAVIAPWHVAVARATDGLFLKVFYLYENMNRFQGHVNHQHREVFYYLPILAYGFFPWVIFLPSAVANLVRAARRRVEPDRQAGDALLLLACFAATVLVFFTMAATKLQTYILPAFPALAILTAAAIDRWTAGRQPVPAWLKPVSALLVVLLGGATIAGVIGVCVVKDVPPWAIVVGAVALVLTAGGWFCSFTGFRRRRPVSAFYALVATTVVGCLLANQVAFAVGYRYRDERIHHLIGPLAGRDVRVALYQDFKPSLMFYLRQPVDSFFLPDNLVSMPVWVPKTAGAKRFQDPPLFVVATEKGAGALVALHGHKLKLVNRQGPWCLLAADGLALQKLPTLEQTFKCGLRLDLGSFTWGTLPFAGGTMPRPHRVAVSPAAPAVSN